MKGDKQRSAIQSKGIHSRNNDESRNRLWDALAGNLCFGYLLLLLAVLAWQLFDTWMGRYSLLRPVGYDLQRQQTLRLIAFTLIAGALGGVINGLRSGLHYRQTFQRRHTWKYLCAPWMGATLALFVYALIRSSIGVLGGSTTSSVSTAQVVSNFAIGALVGYGSKDVFVWLDAKVGSFFEVKKGDEPEPRKVGARTLKRRPVKRTTKRAVRRPAPSRRTEAVPVTISTMDKAH
jgi:hypothetical protein